MVKVTPMTVRKVIGLTLELSADDATHLSYVLTHYRRMLDKEGKTLLPWPWLDTVIALVDGARKDQ